MIRKTPSKRTQTTWTLEGIKRPRRWQCPYDGHLNLPGTKKCSGPCQSKRGKKAKSWEAQARDLHVLYVRPPGTKCCRCGGTYSIQDAHVIGRGRNPNPSVKWHPFNGVPLCSGPGTNDCHRLMDTFRIDPYQTAIKHLGLDRYNELMAFTADARRWSRDWPGVIERLRVAIDQRKAA